MAKAVPIGGVLTTIKFENTKSTEIFNTPVTFAQVFEEGAFPSAEIGAELQGEDGSVIPCQVDVRSLYSTGSVKHAVISLVLPKLAQSVATYHIVRRQPRATGPAVRFEDYAGGNAVVEFVESGVSYFAQMPSVSEDSHKLWLAGDIVGEWEFSVIPKTADGVEHDNLHVRFYTRVFSNNVGTRLDLSIENDWAFAVAKERTYDVFVHVDGVEVYRKLALTHFANTRFRKTFWLGVEQPPVHVIHNIDYLIATKAVPNYDRTVIPNLTTAATYKSNTIVNGEPMGRGTIVASMGSTGGRQDIGILPGMTALYILSMDKNAKEAVLNQGNLAGSWGVHRRDKNTGGVISLTTYPTYPETVPPMSGKSTNPNSADRAHHPDMAFVPYLVTGDVYYLDELQFWAKYCSWAQNPGYRDNEKGLVFPDQVRAQAWSMRSLAHAAYISPEGPQKTEFEFLLKSNLNWYDARYTYSTDPADQLGVLNNNIVSRIHGFSGYKGFGAESCGIAPWQDDHFTSAIGRIVELGYKEAIPLLNWKARFAVGRLYGQAGVCWIQAAAYALRLRDADYPSPLYTTLKEVYDKTFSPAIIAAANNSNCATQEMADAWTAYPAWRAEVQGMPSDGVSNPKIGDMDGYSDTSAGYPSCLQQAIAYCATFDAPNARNAWEVFDGRTVKPNYGSAPQFAIVPRATESSTEIPDVDPPDTDPPDNPTGEKIMTVADRVKDSSTTSGTGNIVVSGTPPASYQSISVLGAVGTKFPYVYVKGAQWEVGEGTLENAVTFSRNPKASSNNNLLVDFLPGTGTVTNDLTAFYLAKFVSTDAPSTDAVESVDTTELYLKDGDVHKRITITKLLAAIGTRVDDLPSVTGLQGENTLQINQAGVDKKVTLSMLGAFLAPTADTTGPSFPDALSSSSVTQSGFTLSWQAATDASGIARYEYSFDGNAWTSAGNNLSVNISGRTAGTLYVMRVRAVDPAGNLSTVRTLNVTTSANTGDTVDPTMSGSLTFTDVTSTGYTVSWQAGSDNVGVDHYELSTDNGNIWVNVGNVLFYNVSGASSATSYNPRVRAHDAAGRTSNVITATVTTLATRPSAPTIGTAVAGDGYIDVYYTLNGNGGSTVTSVQATLSTGETGSGTSSPIRVTCTNGTARTATVRAINAVGTSDPSSTSNSVTPTATVVSPVSSAQVAEASPSDILVTFGSAINTAALPAPSTFSVTPVATTGTTQTGVTTLHEVVSVAAVSGQPNQLKVSVRWPFWKGEEARTLVYTPNGTNDLTNSSGAAIGSFSKSIAVEAITTRTYTMEGPPASQAAFPSTTEASPKVMTAASDPYASASVGFYIKRVDNSSAAKGVRFVWGTSNTTAPCSYNDLVLPVGATGNTSARADAVAQAGRSGGWTDASPTNATFYGLFSANGSLFARGAAGARYLWALTHDGAQICYPTPWYLAAP